MPLLDGCIDSRAGDGDGEVGGGERRAGLDSEGLLSQREAAAETSG